MEIHTTMLEAEKGDSPNLWSDIYTILCFFTQTPHRFFGGSGGKTPCILDLLYDTVIRCMVIKWPTQAEFISQLNWNVQHACHYSVHSSFIDSVSRLVFAIFRTEGYVVLVCSMEFYSVSAKVLNCFKSYFLFCWYGIRQHSFRSQLSAVYYCSLCK
jgi:hypothetical protein